MLCIDGFYIHNREIKKGEKVVGANSAGNNNTGGGGQSLFGSLSTKIFGIKTKKRPLNSVWDVRRSKKDPCDFSIWYKEDDKNNHEPAKEIKYRTYEADDCSEIMAKIRFLKHQ